MDVCGDKFGCQVPIAFGNGIVVGGAMEIPVCRVEEGYSLELSDDLFSFWACTDKYDRNTTEFF